jgi:hypothetical protein
MKDYNYYMLYVHNPGVKMPNANDFDSMNEYYHAYYRYITNIQKETKEICPTCKHVFDKMFELRLQRLSELADAIWQEYQLPSRANPTERGNEDDKKKKK